MHNIGDRMTIVIPDTIKKVTILNILDKRYFTTKEYGNCAIFAFGFDCYSIDKKGELEFPIHEIELIKERYEKEMASVNSRIANL